VADAFVLLAEDGAFGSPSRHRIADADGRFRLDSLPAGRYSLTVEAGGYRTVEVGPLEVAPGLPLHELVVLDRGAVVFGTVVDADGEPVADASVREVPDQPAVSLATVPGQTGTDGDGRYRMEGLPTGRIAIAAEAPGHHRAVREIEAAPGPNRLDLTLERRPVYEVSGRVLDAAGASVAGARVSASGAASQGMGFHADGESGDDGSFSLGEVPDGAFRLHVHHEAFVPYEETIRVAGEPVFRDVRLVSGGAIEGQVLGLGGRHASASVEGRWLGGSGGEGDRVTGVDPRYRLEGLQAGRWQVEAAGPEGRSRPHAVRVGAGETVYLDLELEEEESLELAGQAFRNGLPLAGGRVFSTDPGGGPGASEPIDRVGHFRLTGLRAGTHRLSFLGPEGDLEHRLEVALESGREVVVEWWVATVTGRAVDGEEGTPVAGAEVRLLAEPWGSGGRSRALRTGEDGGFAFDRVGEGSWRVGVEKEGYARRELAIERRGAEPVDGLEVELEPTSGLTLLVRLPTGPPPRSVSATGWDGEGRQALSRTVDTGEGGRVRLPSVGSLPLTLRVTSGAFFGEIPGATAGSGPIAVDLRLGGDLHLVVPELVAEGSTATVTLRDPSGRSAPWVPTTVRGGRLSARTLRPGRWTYRIEAADGRRWTGEVAVAAGAEVAATVE
jgi:protocatechuate 3,4-dioxygenase beta subunit